MTDFKPETWPENFMKNSAREFARLCDSDVLAERRRCLHDRASVETWKEVIALDPDLHACAALNGSIDAETLHLLVESHNDQARLVLAGRRRLLRKTFELLAKDKDENVRAALLGNPRVPHDIAEILRNDPSEWVRSAFQRNPRAAKL